MDTEIGEPRGNTPWPSVQDVPEFSQLKLKKSQFEFSLTLASGFSWRDRGVLPPVADQGSYQTCFAHSLLAALQARRRIANQPIARLDPEMFHACTLGLSLSAGNSLIKFTLDKLVDDGAPLAGSGYSPGGDCGQFTPKVVRALGYNSARSAGLVKDIIVKHAPVVTVVSTEAAFVAVRDFSIYRDQGGERNFHHAMLLVGYNDEDQCWIVQNSMGTGWGDKGFGRIAYGSAGILSDDAHWCYVVS